MPRNPNRIPNPFSSVEEMIQKVPKLKKCPVKLDLIFYKDPTDKDYDSHFGGANYMYPILATGDDHDQIMSMAEPYKDGYLIYFGEDAFSQCVGLYPKRVNPVISRGHDIKGPRISYDVEEFHYDGVDMLMVHYFEPCACMSFSLIKGPKAEQLSDLMSLDPTGGREDYWSRCSESSELIHEYLKSNFNIDWRYE